MHWTHVLTKKEKKHLRENVTVLTGMSSKQVVINELKQCDCDECRAILDKLTAKPTGRAATYVIPVEPVVIPMKSSQRPGQILGHLVDISAGSGGIMGSALSKILTTP